VIEVFDPVTGTKIKETKADGKEVVRGLLGPGVEERFFKAPGAEH
jgi:hypothetical protein